MFVDLSSSRPLSERRDAPLRKRHPVWLFDLDNTLHDASHAAFEPISAAMTRYIAEHLELADDAATALRQRYWKRYGATLLGLVRHHAIDAAHFLDHTHRCPISRRACAAAPTTAPRCAACPGASSC